MRPPQQRRPVRRLAVGVLLPPKRWWHRRARRPDVPWRVNPWHRRLMRRLEWRVARWLVRRGGWEIYRLAGSGRLRLRPPIPGLMPGEGLTGVIETRRRVR